MSLQQKGVLHKQLCDYRLSLCPSQHCTASMIIGIELITGISDQLIDTIVEKATYTNEIDNDTLIDIGMPETMTTDILSILYMYNNY